jgi:shikimate kinase
VADEVREVLAARAHLYEGCADLVIEGADLDGTVERALEVVKTFSERF